MQPVWHHKREDNMKPERQPTAMTWYSVPPKGLQGSTKQPFLPSPALTVTTAVVQAAPWLQAPAEECCGYTENLFAQTLFNSSNVFPHLLILSRAACVCCCQFSTRNRKALHDSFGAADAL